MTVGTLSSGVLQGHQCWEQCLALSMCAAHIKWVNGWPFISSSNYPHTPATTTNTNCLDGFPTWNYLTAWENQWSNNLWLATEHQTQGWAERDPLCCSALSLLSLNPVFGCVDMTDRTTWCDSLRQQSKRTEQNAYSKLQKAQFALCNSAPYNWK